MGMAMTRRAPALENPLTLCSGCSAEGMIGEHLNEDWVTWEQRLDFPPFSETRSQRHAVTDACRVSLSYAD
jgi:hypothetical protein